MIIQRYKVYHARNSIAKVKSLDTMPTLKHGVRWAATKRGLDKVVDIYQKTYLFTKKHNLVYHLNQN